MHNGMHQSAIVLVRCVPGSSQGLLSCRRHIGKGGTRLMRASKKIFHRFEYYDEGLRKQPLSFDDGKNVLPAKNPSQRLQTRCGLTVFHQISQRARNVFDTIAKRRSDSEQPKWHRSDDIGDNARNTEENNELS